MKKLILSIFMCTTFISLQAQYFVLHTKGTVSQKASNTPVKVGDKLAEDTQLLFANSESMAVVMSRGKGRMVLSPQETNPNSEGEFISLLKNALVPMKSNMQMSTRGGSDEKVVNFGDFFGEKDFAIIGNELDVKINEDKYPVDEGKIFVVSYSQDGNPIRKKVPFQEGTLMFKKDELFAEANPEYIDKMELYYYNKATKDFSKVAAFKPIFIDEEELKNEVTVLVGFLTDSGMEKAKIKTEITNFVFDLYGRVDEVQLHQWLINNEII